MYKSIKIIVCFYVLINTFTSFAQNKQRPFIWVQQEDRSEILHKIETEAWALDFYKEFKQRLDSDIVSYKKSPYDFLSEIPFDWSKQKSGKTPPLKTFNKSTYTNNLDRYNQYKYLQIGIDCGVLYFLTEDETYAQCAAAILHAFIEGLLQIEPSKSTGNGGWLYPTDHLREARVIGAQIPIIYDFIASYIEKNNKTYDIGKKGFANFSIENAQKVFLTYAELAVAHGHTGSNWSVLESFSLVQNALALEDSALRKKYVDYYLVAGTNKQDALPEIAENYKNEGDVYPETSQYSNGVAAYTTQMLILLNKYDSNLKLGQKYYKIPFSLDRWNSVRYPNDEIIRFGDGHREFDVPYSSYDMAYQLGKQDNVIKLTDKFGPLVTQSIKKGLYDRSKVGQRSGSIKVYDTPTKLLWLKNTKDYSFENNNLPRTDQFSHAGVFLQRNLSSTGNPDFGLMCFVGGAHMVHGHAGGMDMELYGLGEVLGVDHGRGKYRTDLHENYSRLFAAHNSVIVNGASEGEGGWVSLGMNSTELIMMEPKPLEEAISPNYSFTRTSFLDDKGDKAEATQERTMALIRTSSTSGYYVDVFRSKSELPNEYHDYLYHNIGDELQFLNIDLQLKSDENRFMANANAVYRYNRKYRNPGWHFFKEVKSSNTYEQDVKLTFSINQLNNRKVYMHLFVMGNKNREYTKVLAPKTFEAPEPYHNLPTPTLVIRQKGEAWTNPFAVIYEPTFDKDAINGIQFVEKLENNGVFKGFKVVSKINKNEITQYIINQSPNDLYENKQLEIYFKGSFAVLTFENNKLQNLYIGEGRSLKSNQVELQSTDSKSIEVYIDFSRENSKVNATENTKITIINH